MISRRHFLRQIIILALGLVLELFGYRPKEQSKQASNFYKFKVGKERLTIKPGESFSVKIHWPGDVKIENPTRVTISCPGILYAPLDRENTPQYWTKILNAGDEKFTGRIMPGETA